MEIVISEAKDANMYVVNNNSNQIPVYITENNYEIKEKSIMYNHFTEQERKEFSLTKSAFFFHNFGFYTADFFAVPSLMASYWPIFSFK